MRDLDLIRADMANNPDWRGKISMVLFRLASSTELPRIVCRTAGLIYTVLVGWIFGIELPPGTRVGPGLHLLHATGLVVHPNSIIGAECALRHGCTLGVRHLHGSTPVLGDNVIIGAGAHVIGGVQIGDFSEVGAGAVVLRNVPAHHIAVGNPARVLPKQDR